METKGHLVQQPGLRGHSFNPETTLTERFKIVDVTGKARAYVASTKTMEEGWERALDLAVEADRKDESRIYTLVDSGTGPWPTESVLGFF